MGGHSTRFKCLTNGFSKKVENLEHPEELRFMFYNFGRVNKTLCVTPAMEPASQIMSGRWEKFHGC
jgi:hypothetical protein